MPKDKEYVGCVSQMKLRASDPSPLMSEYLYQPTTVLTTGAGPTKSPSAVTWLAVVVSSSIFSAPAPTLTSSDEIAAVPAGTPS